MEVWKDVVDYDGLYQVSNLGRVKSLNRVEWCVRNNSERVRKEKLLQEGKVRDYRKVCLCKNGIIKHKRIHRLVAEMFIPNSNNLPHINHIDGNCSNNNVENLEWCNPELNVNHAYDNELNSTNDKTVLTNLETRETFNFRSKVKASKFLGKSPNYLCYHLAKGKTILCGYEVSTEKNQWHERRKREVRWY